MVGITFSLRVDLACKDGHPFCACAPLAQGLSKGGFTSHSAHGVSRNTGQIWRTLASCGRRQSALAKSTDTGVSGGTRPIFWPKNCPCGPSTVCVKWGYPIMQHRECVRHLPCICQAHKVALMVAKVHAYVARQDTSRAT